MWVILPIISFALSAWWWWATTKKATGLNLKKMPTEVLASLPRPAALPYDNAVRHVLRYANVFRTLNLASVFSVMSDTYYHTVSSIVQGLNRIGIRKEIYFSPYPEQQEADGLDYTYTATVFSNRKAEMEGTTVNGDYAERYVDSATGNVLYSKEKKNAELTVLTIRSPEREQGQPVYCEGCGMEVQTGGEIFICQHCGATYRADSYDWVTANITTPVSSEANAKAAGTGAITALMYGAMIAAPVLAVLGFFAGGRLPLIILIILGCLYMPAAVFYINSRVLAGLGPFLELAKVDPLASAAIVGFRMGYLLQRLYYAHDHNPGDMRTMMDAGAFGGFAQVPHSGNFVLDVGGMGGGEIYFSIRDGRQYLDVNTNVSLLALTPQRQAVTVERPLHVVFYRNEHTRYAQMLSAQAMKCAGCGMPLDLTAHGACKYCGIEYDVANFDWKIAWIDPQAFA